MKSGLTYNEALLQFISTRTAPQAHNLMHWAQLPFFKNGSALQLTKSLDQRVKNGESLFPPPQDFLNAFALTPFETVKVVILGQDPYPTRGDAHGLAFSYTGHKRLPASLRNIFKELAADLEASCNPPSDLSSSDPRSGDLTHWAEQGVLLLNTALSVTEGQVGSHLKIGWQPLINEVIQTLNTHHKHIVFILWGAKAQHYEPMIDLNRHTVLSAPHPSPLSAYQGFWGSKPFSKANAALKQHDQTPIQWLKQHTTFKEN